MCIPPQGGIFFVLSRIYFWNFIWADFPIFDGIPAWLRAFCVFRCHVFAAMVWNWIAPDTRHICNYRLL